MTVTQRPRVALVTGGSRGIGAEIVGELARTGTRVCFTYVRDEHAARAVVDRSVEAGAEPGAVLAVRADARDEQALAQAFEAAESLGRLEELINNAGSTGRIGPFAEGNNEESRHVVDLNLVAPIIWCREAARRWAGSGEHR